MTHARQVQIEVTGYLPGGRDALRLLAIALVHTLLVRWALTLVTPEEGISLMWLPDGFLFGCLVLLRLRFWPALITLITVATAVLELITTDRPLGMIGLFIVSNLFESVVGALIYRRWCGGSAGLREFRHLSIFILACVLGVPAISALIASAAVVGYGAATDFADVYQTWHSSAGLGILFVAPLVVEGALRWRRHRSSLYAGEAGGTLWPPAGVLALIVIDGALGHSQVSGAVLTAQSLLYFGLPMLCIAAVRFGVWGGVLTSSVMVIGAVQLTALGYGPFSMDGLTAAESVFKMQSYLAMAVIATLFTAVAVERLNATQADLRLSLAGFQTTFEHSPAALFDEDLSAVKTLLRDSRMPRDDGQAWLAAHPHIVRRCASLVRVERVNRRALEIFEAEAEAQLRGGLPRLFSDESLAVFRDELAALSAGRRNFVSEAVHRTLNGRQIRTIVEVVLVPGHENDWRRVIVAIQDVTERYESMRRLKASEARFRTTFDQAQSGIALLTPDGRFIDANQRFCDIVGYTVEELRSLSYIDVTHPIDRPESQYRVEQMLGSIGSSYSIEKRYVRRDASSVWVKVAGNAVRNEEGVPDYFIALIDDIDDRKRNEAALESFFEQPMNLHLLADTNGSIERVNRTWTETLGHEVEAVQGRRLDSFVHDDDIPALQEVMAAARRDQRPHPIELRISNTVGAYRRIALSVVMTPDLERVYASGIDVTEQRHNEARLLEAATVFRSTAEGVMITDLDGSVRDINNAFHEITGYSRAEVIGQNPRILKSGRHDPAFYQRMWQSLEETGAWRGEIWNRRKDGSSYPELLNINVVRDAAGQDTGYVAVFSDISSLKQTEERLEHLAHHDPLTGLPNRLLLGARLRHSIEHAQRRQTTLAVIFIDLDRFKNVNDSLGHAVGDELLKQVARRLSGAIRADDTVARVGGDEFVVLLEDVGGVDRVTMMLEKLAGILQTVFTVRSQEMHITASMGVALCPENGAEEVILLRNADAAMYRAKAEGRNTFSFYTKALTQQALQQVLIESALGEALLRSEFSLVYQPQIRLPDSRVVGVEALIRWHRPDDGAVSPDTFIPIAEQCGRIRDIDLWVLHQACQQAAAWLDEGLSFGRIAVNVSGTLLRQADFADQVESVLARTRLPHEHLALEITEGLVMQDTDSVIPMLARLRGRNVQVAIDDFGTGYSSLSYLKRLPVDKLKIDRSFIRDIPDNPDDAAIAEAVIAMGGALGLAVIAEGVETQAQRRFLTERGCAEAQGYLFSRPVDPSAMEDLLKAEPAILAVLEPEMM